MQFLITGAAGFIGSQICERLIADGHQVVGLDCFTDYYSRELKTANLVNLKAQAGFQLLERDINSAHLPTLLAGTDVVIHLAAQAGVRHSWGRSFEEYIHNNIAATQKLLEAMKDFAACRLVYASSSSVYGDAEAFPTRENSLCRPVSPYGVSKLAAENLCWLYYKNFNVDTVSLRFFTVYGPRQRPDMAFHRFIRAMLEEREITILGDGGQSRDFTFVSDIVDGVLAASYEPRTRGGIFNLGGGNQVNINQVISIMEDRLALKAKIAHKLETKGDVRATAADISRAEEKFGFKPRVKLEDGLQAEMDWLQQNLALIQKAEANG